MSKRFNSQEVKRYLISLITDQEAMKLSTIQFFYLNSILLLESIALLLCLQVRSPSASRFSNDLIQSEGAASPKALFGYLLFITFCTDVPRIYILINLL